MKRMNDEKQLYKVKREIMLVKVIFISVLIVILIASYC
jgi:hypothetical protein